VASSVFQKTGDRAPETRNACLNLEGNGTATNSELHDVMQAVMMMMIMIIIVIIIIIHF
jgi:hypothetical protein